MDGGGQSGGNQTVTQVQQIPQYQQDFAKNNLALAQSLAAQPFQQYQGQLQAPQNDMQMAGMAQAGNAATAYQPGLNAAMQGTSQSIQGAQPGFQAANGVTAQALQQPQGMFNQAGNLVNASLVGQQGFGQGANTINYAGQQAQGGFSNAAGMANQALGMSPANQGQLASFMSPYIMQALQPQIQALQTQLGQQQQGINRQATQANAFGDARQGAQAALANNYGNQAMTGLIGQGYNTAFNNAQQALLGQQQAGLQGANLMGSLAAQQQGLGIQSGTALGNLASQQSGLGLQGAGQLANIGAQQGNLGLQGGAQLGNLAAQQAALGLQGANQTANLAGQQQGLGITGANALYNAGSQMQNQQQQGLNMAYQQFMNQTQYPFQMLNVMEGALANNPYNIVNQTQLPAANGVASGLGAFGSLAGGLGSLLSGGSSGSNTKLGTAYNAVGG